MACIAGLAQLVEHLICNQRVVGSSPTTGTIDFSKNRQIGGFFIKGILTCFIVPLSLYPKEQ